MNLVGGSAVPVLLAIGRVDHVAGVNFHETVST